MPKALPPSFSEFLRVVVKSIAERRRASNGSPALAEDPEVLHRAFYELGRLYRKQFRQLSELHFIRSGAYPYSPELTEALDSLQMSGAIARENPSFERFSPTHYKDTDDVIKAGRNRFIDNDPKKQKAFDKIVEYLDQQLSVGA